MGKYGDTLLISGIDIAEVIVERPEVSVYKGRYMERDVAIKIFINSSSFRREFDAISQLNKKGIAVPELLTTSENNDFNTIVSQWIDSGPLKEKWNELKLNKKDIFLHKIGTLLSEIQFALSPQEINDSIFWRRNNNTTFKDFSWNSYLLEQLMKWISRINLTKSDLRLHIDSIIKNIVQKVSNIPEPIRPAFIHADFTMRNILCDNAENLWAIDFESPLVGDPLFDLARITWLDFDNNNVEILLSSWEKNTSNYVDNKILQLYQMVIAISIIAWVDKLSIVNDDNLKFRNKAINFLVKNGGQ